MQKNREVAEWLKAHAWKACIRQRIEGSNPFLSAITFELTTYHFIGKKNYFFLKVLGDDQLKFLSFDVFILGITFFSYL